MIIEFTSYKQPYVWKVIFSHSQQEGITTCKIIEGERVLSIGKSRCSEMDNFRKATGRKISLARAAWGAKVLQTQPFNIKDFWQAFWLKREQQTGQKYKA